MAKPRVLALIPLITLSTPAHMSESTQVPPFRFNQDKCEVLIASRDLWPYSAPAPGPLDGSNTFDKEGVSIRIIGGVAYDHPVLQAQFMLTRLSSYLHNHDPLYLERIKAHGDRLLKNSVLSRGAMYLPYPFDWALHGNKDNVIKAPWYSAMAQGQALSAFVRLYEVTGEQRYRIAADQLFASFKNLKSTGMPWTVNVDDEGYLWFEEYARDVGADRSVNGHIFAIYGLWDYYRITASEEAKQLFCGGVTAVHGHLQKFRNPGWISRYSLANPQYLYASYHTVHVGQLYQLYNLTGSAHFAVAGDEFIEDYPASQHGGRGYLSRGVHKTLTVDSSGTILDSREISLTAPESVSMSSRQRLKGHEGIWLKVASGTIGGRWVRETEGVSFVKLGTETYNFSPVRLVRFSKGTHRGYQFNSLGQPSESKEFTLTAASAAHVSQRTVMNGVTYFRVVDGVWRDYWVREQPDKEVRAEIERFSPVRLIQFARGTYTGYQYDESGRVIRSKSFALKSDSAAHVNQRSVISGATRFYVTDGVWRDYWIPVGAGIRVM